MKNSLYITSILGKCISSNIQLLSEGISSKVPIPPIAKSLLVSLILKVKIDPLLVSDLTAISPFNYCANILLIVRPNPIPLLLNLLDLLIVPKNLKSLSI